MSEPTDDVAVSVQGLCKSFATLDANVVAAADVHLDLPAAHGTTVVLATHDLDLAARCDRAVHLVDGRLTDPSAVR